MPHLSGSITPWGPLINAIVHVSAPKALALKAANLPVPNPVVAKLVVDTGASLTSIDETLLMALNLTATGVVQIHTPSTQGQAHNANQFDVGLTILGLNNAVSYLTTALPIIDGKFKAQGIDGLLGRDVLSLARMHYGGPDGWYGLSF